MPAPIRQVDELGFPIPAKFAEPAKDSTNEPAERPDEAKPSLARRLSGWWWLALVLLPALLFGGRVIDFGREMVAEALLRQAHEEFDREDFNAARDRVDRALAWEPSPAHRWEAFDLRGQIREQQQELAGSLRDYTAAIDLLNDPNRILPMPELADLYTRRAWVHERLAMQQDAAAERLLHHRDAIADAIEAVSLVPKADRRQMALLLNQRAYIRALAGLELNEASHDIDQALDLVGQDLPGFIDTRAYVRFQLGQLEPALADIQRAIQSTEEMRNNYLRQTKRNFGPFRFEDHEYWQRELTTVKHDLAVMYQHRSQILEKQGEKDPAQATAAKADAEKAKEYGYDPAKGVF